MDAKKLAEAIWRKVLAVLFERARMGFPLISGWVLSFENQHTDEIVGSLVTLTGDGGIVAAAPASLKDVVIRKLKEYAAGSRPAVRLGLTMLIQIAPKIIDDVWDAIFTTETGLAAALGITKLSAEFPVHEQAFDGSGANGTVSATSAEDFTQETILAMLASVSGDSVPAK